MEQQGTSPPTGTDAAAIDQRLQALEAMLADSLGRIDRLHGIVDLLAAEIHARRREQSPDGVDPARWSAAGFPIAPRNRPVAFGLDHPPGDGPVEDYLVSGWWAREAWGVWGKDTGQTLRFALDDYRGGYVTLHLTVQAFIPPGSERPAVDISANGYFLGSHVLGSAPQTLRLRLPPSCIGVGDIILLLQHDNLLSPAALDLSADERMLGIGLLSFAMG